MLNPYTLRITSSDQTSVITLISGFSEAYVISKEKGSETGKDHFHAYLESILKMATIRSRIRKRLVDDGAGTGNGVYSFKRCSGLRPADLLCYITKTNNVVAYKGFTEAEMELIAALEADKKATHKKEKKDRNHLSKMRDLIISGIAEMGDDFKINPCSIANLVVDYYKQNRLMVRFFYLQAQVETLCLEFVASYRDELCDRIVRNISHYDNLYDGTRHDIEHFNELVRRRYQATIAKELNHA